jgi:putative endonuclease
MAQKTHVDQQHPVEVEHLLVKHGYRIIARHYQAGRSGTLDLVCLEGHDLVFVEVRVLQGEDAGAPLNTLSYYKQQSLRRAADHFRFHHSHLPDTMRFDVVAIVRKGLSTSDMHLYKHVPLLAE